MSDLLSLLTPCQKLFAVIEQPQYDFFLNGKTPQDFLRRYTISILKGERRFEERQVQRYPLYKIFYGNKESEKYGRNLMTDEKLGWGVKTPDCSFCVELETTPLTQFAWPPGISFPIQVKAVVRDSSNPPKQVVQEMVIPEGTKGFPKPWVNWQYGTYTLYWLEIDRKMYLPEGYTLYDLSGNWDLIYSDKKTFSEEKRSWGPFKVELQQDGLVIKGIVEEKDPETGKTMQNIEGYIVENKVWLAKKGYRHYYYNGIISDGGKIIKGGWDASHYSSRDRIWSMTKK